MRVKLHRPKSRLIILLKSMAARSRPVAQVSAFVKGMILIMNPLNLVRLMLMIRVSSKRFQLMARRMNFSGSGRVRARSFLLRLSILGTRISRMRRRLLTILLVPRKLALRHSYRRVGRFLSRATSLFRVLKRVIRKSVLFLFMKALPFLLKWHMRSWMIRLILSLSLFLFIQTLLWRPCAIRSLRAPILSRTFQTLFLLRPSLVLPVKSIIRLFAWRSSFLSVIKSRKILLLPRVQTNRSRTIARRRSVFAKLSVLRSSFLPRSRRLLGRLASMLFRKKVLRVLTRLLLASRTTRLSSVLIRRVVLKKRRLSLKSLRSKVNVRF